jgi:hypothetical protein
VPIDDKQTTLSEPAAPAPKITEPEPTSWHIGYGVYLCKPKPDLHECAAALRRVASGLHARALGHERRGFPASERDTLVFELTAIERALALCEAVAECEQPVMRTILAARKGSPGEEKHELGRR